MAFVACESTGTMITGAFMYRFIFIRDTFSFVITFFLATTAACFEAFFIACWAAWKFAKKLNTDVKNQLTNTIFMPPTSTRSVISLYKTILQFKASCPTILKKSGCLITLASKVLTLIKARDRFSQVNSKLTISKLATNFSLMLSITLATFEERGTDASIICLVSSVNELRRAAKLSSNVLSELDAVSETRDVEGTALKRVMLNSLRAKLSSRLVHCMTSSCREVLIERRSSIDRLNALVAGVLVVGFVGDLGGGGAAFFGGGCGILSPIFIASITRSSAKFKLMTGSCGCEDTCNLPKLTTTADCLPGRKIPPIDFHIFNTYSSDLFLMEAVQQINGFFLKINLHQELFLDVHQNL
ncbi:hypothetical protein GQX74_013301 [Glossina fuscipes]|nr:hypothetical protein GQX74_013301 [Glossina fuscipes]